MQDISDFSSNEINQCLHIQYFREYSNAEQSLTYSFQKLVETPGTSETLLETMVTGDSLEFRGTINNSIDDE
jgi:hypothetical protein